MARVQLINTGISNVDPTGESKAKLNAPDLTITGGGNYVVTIGIGTPKREYTVVVDTASEYTWIQCLPCPTCYPQQDPMFDPSTSSTYSKGQCKSHNTDDAYSIQYADGSYSNGNWGCDTLTLEPPEGITNFQFGCGQKSSPGFGDAAGMLGLGGGDLSLISQTTLEFGNTFSYCLPTPSSHGYLLFGNRARSPSSSLKFTPLLKDQSDYPFYFLKLVAISIAGKKLSVSPSVFSSPGTVIDSGTVITRLPVSVYSALKSAFQKSMSKYPPASPFQHLDTCYNLEGYMNVAFPKIVFHFGGGTDVTLNTAGVLWTVSRTQVCLAFAAKAQESDFTIIGNHQQQELDVFYDIKGGRVGFGTGGCGN